MVIETNGAFLGLGMGAIILMVGKAIWNTSAINKDVKNLKTMAHVPPCREFTALDKAVSSMEQKLDDSIETQDKNQVEILTLLRGGCAPWTGDKRRTPR